MRQSSLNLHSNESYAGRSTARHSFKKALTQKDHGHLFSQYPFDESPCIEHALLSLSSLTPSGEFVEAFDLMVGDLGNDA